MGIDQHWHGPGHPPMLVLSPAQEPLPASLDREDAEAHRGSCPGDPAGELESRLALCPIPALQSRNWIWVRAGSISPQTQEARAWQVGGA